MVVGEGAAPSRHANLAFSGAYKTLLHGWCYPPMCEVVLSSRETYGKNISTAPRINSRSKPGKLRLVGLRMLELRIALRGNFAAHDEGWICESGMPAKPRGQRGDDGYSCARRVRIDASRGRSRSVSGQYVQLHRGGAKRIGGRHPGDGG